MLVHEMWKNTVRKQARKCSSFLFTNKMGKFAVVRKWEVTEACLKVQSLHLPEETEEYHRNLSNCHC